MVNLPHFKDAEELRRWTLRSLDLIVQWASPQADEAACRWQNSTNLLSCCKSTSIQPTFGVDELDEDDILQLLQAILGDNAQP